jgi:magnesium-protoporphyrin O-methyltransferase
VIDSAQHKARLRDYFDGLGFERWSAIYGEGELSRVRRTIRAGHSAMLEVAAAWIDEAAHAPGALALDAGCGTGLWSLALARRGLAVTAVDIAPQMVAATERAVADAGLEGRVACLAGDLDAVGGSFDLVSCFDVVIHYPPEAALTMCAGLAERCRGRLFLTYAPWNPLLAALHWVGGHFPRSQRRTEIQMLPDRLVRDTLAAAGMRVVRTKRVSSGFYHVTLLEARRVDAS